MFPGSLFLRFKNTHQNTRPKTSLINAGKRNLGPSCLSPLLQSLQGRAKSLAGRLHQNAHFTTRGPELLLQSFNPKCCVRALRRERGARGGEGGPWQLPPRFLCTSASHSCSGSQSSYVCALESEELQPALPRRGGKKGRLRKQSRARRQRRRCPAGPSHGGARGAQGPRIPPPSPLFPPGAAWPAGVQPTLLRGRPGAAHQPEKPGSPSHSPQQQEPSNSAATKGHISAPPGGRRRRCLEQPPPPPPPPLPSREPTSSAAAVTGRSGRPGCPGARARARRPAPAPTPRGPRTRTPPRLAASSAPRCDASLTPSSGQAPAGSAERDPACSRAARAGLPARRSQPDPPALLVSGAGLKRRSVGHTRSPEFRHAPLRSPAAGHSPLAKLTPTSEPPSPSLPPLRVWALLLLSQSS